MSLRADHPTPSPERRVDGPSPAHDRETLAQSLHDNLCQTLSGLQMLVRLAERRAARECPALAADLTEIRELLRQAGDETHRVVQLLRHRKGGEGHAGQDEV